MNVHDPPTQRSPSLQHISTSSSCSSSLPHDCKGCGSEFFRVTGGCSRCYIVKNALCAHQQLVWGRKAVEEYSKAEHTNLTNLAKQQYEEMSNETKASTSLEDMIENDLWNKSASENNKFHSLKKLRWSCLGYHYGKVSNSDV